MGREEVGSPWSAVGSAEEEEAGCGRTWSLEKAWRTAARRNEKVASVPAAAEAEGLLGSLEAGVERLHVPEEAGGTGVLAATGRGWEAGGRSGLVGVEGSEQRGWSPAGEAGVPVCRVEVVEVRHLLCSPPF